jgi:hypothetical protein
MFIPYCSSSPMTNREAGVTMADVFKEHDIETVVTKA